MTDMALNRELADWVLDRPRQTLRTFRRSRIGQSRVLLDNHVRLDAIAQRLPDVGPVSLSEDEAYWLLCIREQHIIATHG